jgi:hypothetical protein
MDEAHIYTLRVWHHGGQWHAAVRAVSEECVHEFSAPEPLVAWLMQAPPVPQPPEEPGAPLQA